MMRGVRWRTGVELRRGLGEAGGGGEEEEGERRGCFCLTYFDPGLLINQGGLVVGPGFWIWIITKKGPVWFCFIITTRTNFVIN